MALKVNVLLSLTRRARCFECTLWEYTSPKQGAAAGVSAPPSLIDSAVEIHYRSHAWAGSTLISYVMSTRLTYTHTHTHARMHTGMSSCLDFWVI